MGKRMEAVDSSRLDWFVDESGGLLDEDLPQKQWTTLFTDYNTREWLTITEL